MQTHTPTVVEVGRRGWNLSLEFSPRYDIHGKFLSSIDTFFVVYKMMLILWDKYAN